MKFLHDLFEKQRPLFEKGGKFEKYYYLFEAQETFVFTPPSVTKPKGAQIKDAVDLKRLMITVLIAMIPCLIFGLWNAGHQHFLAIGEAEASFMDKMLLGLRYGLPIIIVSYLSGGLVEMLFTVLRKHPLTEGFLVTGMLIPLVLPITIPLWQVAFATIFAVVIAKEVFGGVGMNILNVALTARAFLYFAYPAEISGDTVWTFIGEGQQMVDGFTGATFLGLAAGASTEGVNVLDAVASWNGGMYEFNSLFLGTIPGSIGETSALMCLIGALVLILTRVGSWKIIFSVFVGAYVGGLIFNAFGANTFMQLPAHYHLVIGGLAFGAVFMATDPVTASQTEKGKWIYGFLIGILTVIIRVFNPAYPEGIMLAILLMNVFAPLIDFYVIKANKTRRLQRATV
ncbi:NADH:ubiquinone reductase (Na(+)-transporting) subunit B [Flexithrix dorotheae]|uniref:NADH:ubiquinone reductase (Na(+)-transporting) subunit B n=1 Tax=Flexithrix dorotheae TaxID=70993 RepID=UPI00036593C9|nr:NADH:ubiquinone reductase (Na(+)-transporting) subunit B [Flexithrix dorotheae]